MCSKTFSQFEFFILNDVIYEFNQHIFHTHGVFTDAIFFLGTVRALQLLMNKKLVKKLNKAKGIIGQILFFVTLKLKRSCSVDGLIILLGGSG